ncbi:DUF4142 domain-containing protein [Allomuricauda sp. F6463D]|uniref:DUF4142 domain-containing protein n=1 Tax=Allomuricauda sp. F6463D TaxID=2926409 RepID=UPI001FF1D943|nr:DUF4142 domain-containing protein [Muricauda sp. F6463D]MCK0159101.1 DUF4142 domain-containing protein [Muricauda sp. F6463D]
MKNILSLLMIATISICSYGQGTQLEDTEVASVAVVANQIDIDYAQIALKKSDNKEIREFANRMVNDHKAVIGQAAALVKKLGVDPKDNVVSQSLLKDAQETIKKLKRTSKRQFDMAYINNEVTYHKAVINAINSVLIPETENDELKQLLSDVVPALEAHLGHAEMVQKNIKSH